MPASWLETDKLVTTRTRGRRATVIWLGKVWFAVVFRIKMIVASDRQVCENEPITFQARPAGIVFLRKPLEAEAWRG